MYVIQNSNGLYLQQGKSDDYSFTADAQADAQAAIKFIAEEDAALKIKKLHTYKGLRPVKYEASKSA